MSVDDFTDVLDGNRAFATAYRDPELPPVAGKELAVLTCMDARLDPLRILGLGPGDAAVLRNAGARVTPDVLATLALASSLLGVRRVLVMAHTRCRMASGGEEAIHDAITAAGGPDTRSLPFLATDDQERSLREDTQRIRSSPYLRDVAVGGFIVDLADGALRQVC